MTETPEAAPNPEPAPRRNDIVAKIAGSLKSEFFGTGPLAELRRLDPKGVLGEPALHRTLARHVPEAWLGDEGLREWALVIHCLALAAPDDLDGGTRLGAALFAAGFGETRLANLLDADAVELRDRLPRAVRFLVHRGGKVPGSGIADLVMTDRRHDGDGYDRLRRRIAGDYYAAEYKAEQAAASSSA